MLIKEKTEEWERTPWGKSKFFSSLYVVYPDINCDIFNTAHILSLQSATDFLLDEIQLHLNCLVKRCEFVQLGLRAHADTRGSSIPWNKMDGSSKWSKVKQLIMVLLQLLALNPGGNNPVEMHEIVHFPKLRLHAFCKFSKTLLYWFCSIPT